MHTYFMQGNKVSLNYSVELFFNFQKQVQSEETLKRLLLNEFPMTLQHLVLGHVLVACMSNTDFRMQLIFLEYQLFPECF